MPDTNDEEEPEWDEADAGPMYWMHKRSSPSTVSRCLKCNMKQLLDFDRNGPMAQCPKCKYIERL